MLSSQKHSVITLVIALFLLAGGVLLLWSYDTWHRDKIMPGVVLGHMPVGGFSPEYARDLIDGYKDRLKTHGALFHFKGKRATLYPRVIPLNSDLPLEASTALYDIDTDATIAALTAVGRTGSFFESQLQRASAAMNGATLSPMISLDTDAMTAELQREFSFFHSPAQDASFILEGDRLVIVTEKRGFSFDYPAALAVFTRDLSTLSMPAIELHEGPIEPAITTYDLELLHAQADELTADAFTVSFEKKSWIISRAELVSWLRAKKNDGGTLALVFDPSSIASYLSEHVAPDVRSDVVHPRFEMSNGRVTAFAAPRDGRALDIEKTVDAVLASLSDHTAPAELAFTIIQSPYQTRAEGAPVITDLLARGETSFAGSPPNRKKNIARGAELINGILLAPGEEFSTIKALGKIDDTNGFLSELVIKGDKTTPEFGGGLCQVSTTLFRAVSFAGFEVLERRNHSYRVSYYEPPVGFDATIYDPAPDFKFKNDTEHHALVQSRVSGDSMIVELWGTKDGRKVEVDTPRVFNIKKPAEPKIIETDELPPGEKKRIERAHNGADAVFERRITYADGTTKKETYRSHYVVWPEVWLKGKTPEESAEPDGVPEKEIIAP